MSHAPLAPSAAHRWMNCPGSVAASRGIESPETVHSREGTFGHDMAAKCLLLGCRAGAYRGTQSPGGEFTFDGPLLDGVQVYLDVICGLMLTVGDTLHVEQKVQLTPNVYGTADALIWEPDHRKLHVIDLKLGAGNYVEVVGNEQLLTYALAALASVGGNPFTVEEVELHIVQPRYPGAEPHRRWLVSRDELLLFQQRVARAETATEKPNAPLVAGDHCKWCVVKSSCKALQARALEAAQDVFDDLTDPTVTKAPPLVESISDDRLAKIVQAADIVESWVSAVRKEAFARAAAGKTLPGLKLVEKIGNRKWADEAKAVVAIRAFGADPYDMKVVSPAEAERRAPAAKKHLAGLTVRPVTGVSLVPESDKRPAITRSAADMFPQLEGDS